MSDPLGLIGQAGASHSTPIGSGAVGSGKAAGGPSFRDVLMENIDKVNELQNDARSAMEDWTSGRRDDIEGVMARLEAKGVGVLLPITQSATGSKISYIEGPDRVRIELVQVSS